MFRPSCSIEHSGVSLRDSSIYYYTLRGENNVSTVDTITDDIRYNEMKSTIVKKAVSLLEEDLFEHVTDTNSQEYFNARVTYLYLVASTGDSNLLTTRYLRSLHSLFNGYYQSYQSSSYGTEVSDTDKERHFLYREVNDQLEYFISDY